MSDIQFSGNTPVIKSYRRLVKAVQDLSMARELDTVTRIVREVARELTGADGATFVLRRREQCFYVDESAIGPLWKGKYFPMNECISGWVMMNARSVVIEDVMSDPRIPQEVYRKTFVKSLCMVPIRKDNPLGAIGTYWGETYQPTEEELDLLQSLADITAVTLENIAVNDELEHRVKERTRELEELNKELESFSYSVSHDLRSPLRGIHGFMSILFEDHGNLLTPEARKIADRVMQNANHMTVLIDDLLTFFKMGQKEVLKSRLPMKLIAQEICEELLASEKQREIKLHIDELPEAYADNVLIRQVWLNFLSNAIKYTGKKALAEIEVGFQKKENETWYFVKDNGSGFDMNYYHKLFGVFQRLHSQREFEGTGIGLAIVEKIVTRHGGRVWAESVVDKGSTFYFSLPD